MLWKYARCAPLIEAVFHYTSLAAVGRGGIGPIPSLAAIFYYYADSNL